MQKRLLSEIRFWILLITVIFSAVLFFLVRIQYPEGSLRIIRLTQLYGFTSIVLLYFTLLAGPFCYLFRWFPYSALYLKARRALGVSAYYFAALHGINAFFRQLGGFSGLAFLSPAFLTGIIISFIAFIIFSLMAITSSDVMIKRLTFPRWKFLHRFVYLAGILVLLHMLMLGSHFSDLSSAIPVVFFAALTFLMILEGFRIDSILSTRFGLTSKFGLGSTVVIAGFTAIFVYMMLPEGNISPFGIHREHKKMEISEPMTMSSMPGMQGDKSKRYSVSFHHPDVIQVNEPVPLTFNVYDASSGNRILFFQTPYEKPFHLIIVDRKLTYFAHIHPEFDQLNRLTISHKFPESGTYNLYADFQPFGATEQQFAFSIVAGDVSGELPIIDSETSSVQEADGYRVELEYKNTSALVRVSDANTGNPVRTLYPYLNAYAHMVMINTRTYEYFHIHPKVILGPGVTELGGPDVELLPMSLYGSLKPGIYRVFVELYPDNRRIIPSFTIELH